MIFVLGDTKALEMLADRIFNFKIIFLVLLFSSFIAFYRYIIVRIYDKGLHFIEHLKGIEMFLKGVGNLKYKTPQQAEMEKLLPYAILLGMQNQWVSKMEEYFNFTPPKNDVFSNSVSFSSISSALRAGATPESGGRSGGFSGGGAGGGGGGGF